MWLETAVSRGIGTPDLEGLNAELTRLKGYGDQNQKVFQEHNQLHLWVRRSRWL